MSDAKWDYRAELKEPGERTQDPWIFLNFYNQSLPEARIILEFRTDDYDEKFEIAEELSRVLNRLTEHLG